MGDSTVLAEDFDDAPLAPPEAARPRRRARRALLVTGTALAAALGGLWLARDRIADRVIGQQLAGLGLSATYEIDTIAPGVEVLRNIVVGDPRHPDLTIDRAEFRVVYGLGLPEIGKVILTRPRIHGRWQDGRLSLGALDKLIYPATPSKAPFRLPRLDLTVIDGQGMFDSEAGRIAVRAAGSGALRDGFAGTLAVAAPHLNAGGCDVRGANLAGRLRIAGEKPHLAGPLRFDRLDCATRKSTVDDAVLDLDLTMDRDFQGLVSRSGLRTGAFALGGLTGESLALDSALAWRGGVLGGRLAANAGGVHANGATVALLSVDGRIATRKGFSAIEFRGGIDGQGLRRGAVLDRALASTGAQVEGTLFAPMVAQVRQALAREERGSRVTGEVSFRRQGGDWSLVVPAAALRGGSGAALVSLSRFQVAGAEGRMPRMAGAFSTGGAGLPHLSGRLEQSVPGRAVFRLAMDEYRAGGGAVAIPALMVAQVEDGSLGFSGEARVSGAIPGGRVQGLVLPLHGAYSARGELALWRRCVTPRFDALQLGAMALDRQSLTICPAGGTAIVRQGAGGLRIGGGTDALALSGKLGETPVRLQSGPVGFAWPGTITARGLNVALGPDDTATRLKLAELVARLGGDYAGTFAGVEARLAATPLDVTGAKGDWRYADGKLVLADTSFDLTDRQNPARFEKLIARGATLTLADNRIDAEALLRHPASDREVGRAVIRHDLTTATGHADLTVPGLVFDKGLQPDELTRLALGVVANAAGTVKGSGRIDWTQRGVTSSGTFGSDNLDLAAAFGPVKGLSGSLRFTDLLGLVTAPHQVLKVAAVNPGIEVNDGTIDIQLLPGQVLRLNGAHWPFLGGNLALEPTELRLGLAETRRYTLLVDGLDAAKFLARLELGNLSATGIFDGKLPLVFDADGGRIEGGNLVSRAPGGNVSYVGALTYKDLSPMANYAFDQLKSLDYRNMAIAMRGDLEGEIVTNVKFAGVKQGAGIKRNFLTKQLADLPIQFNVNIRAPFYQLITSVKAMYDPAFIKDPRTLGLVDAKGRPITRLSNGVRPGGTPVIVLPAMPSGIQPPASGKMP
ncbi:YdbH domain-containing protein [Novosphingobium percolationis]|uniref:YdbH domain-containing protein n=1 Tax=Novosphingobium percolationis TaxID=2871811 RepID=UPI001CD7EB3F|nr:YdbH domain-containing protein [Novosphingobium percolationis]